MPINAPNAPLANTGTLGAVARCLLGGSWVVISGVISPLIWVITIVTLLITPLITTHEPPSAHVFGDALSSTAQHRILQNWTRSSRR